MKLVDKSMEQLAKLSMSEKEGKRLLLIGRDFKGGCCSGCNV